MGKIDHLVDRALKYYNEPNITRNDFDSLRRELSQLELEIQSLLQKEPIKLQSIRIHAKAKKPVSSEKLSYCFSNLPLKFSSFGKEEGVSAFDMIDFVNCLISEGQRYGGQKIFGSYNRDFLGPALIHKEISEASSEELFICEEDEGFYRWNLYLPAVFSSAIWDETQPDENLKPERFLINHRLFEVSNIREMKGFSYQRSGGTLWGKNNFRVYFGNLLVDEMNGLLNYLPQET